MESSGPADSTLKHAIVTGASAGIGKAFAVKLAKKGYSLTLIARRKQVLESLAQELIASTGSSIKVCAADLSQVNELRRVAKQIKNTENLQLMVNNAGFGVENYFPKTDIEEEIKMLRVNVEAVVRLTHAALETMLPRKRGAIINVSSIVSFFPTPFFATYGATKSYVSSFTEAIAEEIAGKGVQMQVLCPGFTRTEFQKTAGFDKKRVPSILWMEADQVVDASLEALQRKKVICVPGMLNQLQSWLSGPISRLLIKKVIAAHSATQK